MSRKSAYTVRLRRYIAKDDNGQFVKDKFISGEQYIYDTDGAVLYRDDIDDQGNIIENPQRRTSHDSTGKLVEERFYRNDSLWREIIYRGTAAIIESRICEGLDFLIVRRIDLYPVRLMIYASKNEQTLEFVDVEDISNSAHLFSEYENTENGYTIEYLYFENGKLMRVSHIYNNGINNGRRKVVATYDGKGRAIFRGEEYDESETRLNYTLPQNYLLESMELRELNGSPEKWTYAIMEYFNGKDKRIEVVERESIQHV